MKFYIFKASDGKYKEEVEINTVEEIVELSNKFKFRHSNTVEGIIIKGNQIQIYDDYIE